MRFPYEVSVFRGTYFFYQRGLCFEVREVRGFHEAPDLKKSLKKIFQNFRHPLSHSTPLSELSWVCFRASKTHVVLPAKY